MTYFASNLKALLKAKGISQKTLANELNISNTAISSWFVGKSKPTIDTLIELRDFLEVSLDDLFFRDFTKIVDGENTNEMELNEPTPQYGRSEVTIYIEKECGLTGGKCAFELVPELKSENEALRKRVEELEKKKK